MCACNDECKIADIFLELHSFHLLFLISSVDTELRMTGSWGTGPTDAKRPVRLK